MVRASETDQLRDLNGSKFGSNVREPILWAIVKLEAVECPILVKVSER